MDQMSMLWRELQRLKEAARIHCGQHQRELQREIEELEELWSGLEEEKRRRDELAEAWKALVAKAGR